MWLDKDAVDVCGGDGSLAVFAGVDEAGMAEIAGQAQVTDIDLVDRPPRAIDDGDVIDLGCKTVRYLATPHVPHGWEAGVLFEESTSTLLCGDLFTQLGDGPAISTESPMEPAIVAEDAFGYSTLAPSSASTVERLADLTPTTLALMHGPTYTGAGDEWLRDLAIDYRRRSDLALASL